MIKTNINHSGSGLGMCCGEALGVRLCGRKGIMCTVEVIMRVCCGEDC